MNSKIKNLLDGKGGNYILPFFWQHGEDDATLRKYMAVIQQSNIGAICVESRPHPDFCGQKWWQDMDIILDEARKRSMKVWILDDSHFPTGYANGALKDAPEELCRQYIVQKSIVCKVGEDVRIDIENFLRTSKEKKTFIDKMIGMGQKPRAFSDDTLLCVTAYRLDGDEQDELTDLVKGNELRWQPTPGEWKVSMCKLTRKGGMHQHYINMLDEKSCRVLIDAVYEPHYTHYADDFGKTIAGFFSDEPELGNGGYLNFNNPLGTVQPLPWSKTLESRLQQVLGVEWKKNLGCLWENDLDKDLTARVRYAYMDAVTRLVEKGFSFQVGDWCRAHGVEYIGHVIEDNNKHARTGASLGHFFRGLAGQDMAGIDDIGGQVYPQGEDEPKSWMRFLPRDGEFYHYTLGRLGSSHAVIDPLKKGRTMCEIFGNYGWNESLRLEKYLADHFMVRGVNHYVPHAFSPKAFPDPDCPPHFYAHGHNPQYRAFGYLMQYMNRICELITDGKAVTPVAILYHGEAEWTGKCMLMQKPARVLADRQINYDFVPSDVFSEVERFRTDLSNGLTVNGNTYKALVVPTAEFVSADFARSVGKLTRMGFPVIFIDALPIGIFNGDKAQLSELDGSRVTTLKELAELLDEKGVPEISISPVSNRLRYYHYVIDDDIFMFVNEAASLYEGEVKVPVKGRAYAYDAWDNHLETVNCQPDAEGSTLSIKLPPFKSLIVVFDDQGQQVLQEPLVASGREIALLKTWQRSLCRSIDYPQFGERREVSLPDDLAKEKPKFSGFVRYENEFELQRAGDKLVLEVSEAWEGVEAFVNGVSAGIQIVPRFVFDITELAKPGRNTLVIEVSTTLERERAAARNRSFLERLKSGKAKDPTGITGTVRLFIQDQEK